MSRPFQSHVCLQAETNKTVGRTLDTGDNATEYTLPFRVSNGDVWSAHMIWTGSSLSVTTTLWASNFENPVLTTDADWVNVTGSLTMPSISTSSGGSYFGEFGNSGGYQYRFKFATTNGTGTMKCIVHGKE